jgi:cytochrome c peroxidase
MIKKESAVLPFILISTLVGCGGDGGTSAKMTDPLVLKQTLGKNLFFDTNLSTPVGQSCATCHDPATGFADPDVDSSNPVSEGAVAGRFANRNAPTAAYTSLTPDFSINTVGEFIGGQFIDGRAVNLIEQAKQPFLNPLEMNNPDTASVIQAVRNSGYTDLFEQVYGVDSLSNTDTAYEQLADAIASFEQSEELNTFTSKFDYFLNGQAELTQQERNGFILFDGKGQCFTCHEMGQHRLFSNHTYSNIGVPKNPTNPFYTMPPEFNPDGTMFIDLGLGANPAVLSTTENGKFRVPTLRNVSLTAPYMHNGVFQTLKEVVDFYNTRDVLPVCPGNEPNCWPVPEVSENMDIQLMGDLGLTPIEVNDIVAFLNTLNDGYEP